MINMMKPIYIIALMAIGCAGLTTSCTDYVQSEPEKIVKEKFDGKILDYLSASHDDGLKFDSVLYILDMIPELKDELTRADSEVTLFAPSDKSVGEAIYKLNLYRRSNGIGDPVYLKDLLVEPFSVQDTTILVNKMTEELDTIYSWRGFDYRGQMDILLSRYCFEGDLNSDYVIDNGGSVKRNSSRNEIEMVVEAGRYDAYGALGTGVKYLYLVETNGSNMQSVWVKAEASKRDIKVSNGTIHVLSDNHEFGFNLFIDNFKDRGTEKGVKIEL